jgi:hypothetical protein
VSWPHSLVVDRPLLLAGLSICWWIDLFCGLVSQSVSGSAFIVGRPINLLVDRPFCELAAQSSSGSAFIVRWSLSLFVDWPFL